MSTAVKEMHAFDAAKDAGRQPFKVADCRWPNGAGRKFVSPSTRCPA